MDQAVQIVVSEIETLERRVRAFSEFASEPPVHPEALDINAVVTERVALLRPAHPGRDVSICGSTTAGPRVHAAPDLVKGILTNLLENAAEAAGPGGAVLRADAAERRARGDRGARFRTGLSEEVVRDAVRADDHVQEARDGARPVDRQEERAAVRRRHHADPGELGGAGFRVARCRS